MSVFVVTPEQPSRRFLAPGDKLGKYEVIRQIAVGGMAELYLTRTVGIEGFEKLVCVKRILPHFSDDPSFVNMFLNEARLAATLHHPNIAQIYDIGQEQGEFFFSMEYVHGEDLGRLVVTGRENGVVISLDCALTLVAGLCAGLHHAHEKASPDGKPLGVVHRDVSPTNVLVSYDGAVKLVDFGIARAGQEPSSQTGLKGKISYMSPEQCRGVSVLDRRSDVFSVGTILYELTTGRLPFIDATEYGVLQQIVSSDPPRPSALVQGYPPALEAIVLRALARNPDRRFSTALELQNQLEDFAHDNRLRVSPLVLARLMSTLFPARLEEWDHARSQGAFFVEQHVVRTLIESRKTTDSSPAYLPQPLPPVDDASGSLPVAIPSPSSPAMESEPTEIGTQPRIPTQPPMATAGSSQPRIPATPAGQSQPRIPTTPPGQSRPRISTTPPPGQSQPRIPPMPTAGAAQPRIPTTPPGQSQPHPRVPTSPPATIPTTPPGAAGNAHPPVSRAARQVPVPNMPGAVPIMMPLPPPPVPSGGTLVSSATQAGNQPPAVAALPARYGAPMMAGYAGPGAYEGAFGPETPPGGYIGPSTMPAGSGFAMQGAQGGYAGQGAPGGYGAQNGPFTAPGGSAEDDTDQVVRVSAPRPTLVIRHAGRSRLPLAAVAVVGAAGALVGVWLAIRSDAGATGPAASAPPGVAPAPAAAPGNPPEPIEATRPDPASAPEPTAPAAGDVPKPEAARAEAARPETGSGSTTVAPAVEPGAPGVPPVDGDAKDPTKKRAAKLVQPDPRNKPAKPKVRPEAKRLETKRPETKRGPKPESKEPSWNADSPFLPVTTPKR